MKLGGHRRRSALGMVAVAVSGVSLIAGCSSSGPSGAGGGDQTSSTTESAPSGKITNANPDKIAAAACLTSICGFPNNQIDEAATAYAPTGQIIADDGFRPPTDSFTDINYGAQVYSDGSAATQLLPGDIEKLLGPSACVDPSASTCTLVPEAQAQMDQWNNAVSGGHCYGFSVMANAFYMGKYKPSDFGSDTVPGLKVSGNSALQEALATAWAEQFLNSVASQQITGTPNDIIAALKKALVPSPTETYTIAISQANGQGGHAVTPYAIEDAGGGIDKILIYDNNFPLITHAITVDTNANSWTYNAQVNPSAPSEVYTGSGTTNEMVLDPVTPGLVAQSNSFTTAPSAPQQSSATSGTRQVVTTAADSELDDIYLEGGDTDHANLLITDAQGHRLGFVDGKLVNEIPGAHYEIPAQLDYNTSQEPDFYVPDGQKYTITIDGSGLKAEDDETVGVIAPYFDLSVDNLKEQPGETDALNLGVDGASWSFKASQAQSPVIDLGISDETADWDFTITGDEIPAGSETNVALPDEGGTMTFGTAAGAPQGNYKLDVERDDDSTGAVNHFSHSGIALAGGDNAALDFGDWANGQSMQLTVTPAGGSPQTQSLDDQNPN